MIKRTALLLLILNASVSRGAEISPRRVIENVEKALTSEKTVRLDFEETYVWKLTGEEQSLRGELLLSGKDRFRVTTEDQIIVSDGNALWTYSKPSHRVLVDRLANSENAILPRQILFQYTRDYQSRVVGEGVYHEKPCYELLFTSETGDVFFPEIRVWIDSRDWMPIRVEQADLNDNRTVYTLENMQVGIAVEEDAFRFSVPEGAEVIDMR